MDLSRIRKQQLIRRKSLQAENKVSGLCLSAVSKEKEEKNENFGSVFDKKLTNINSNINGHHWTARTPPIVPRTLKNKSPTIDSNDENKDPLSNNNSGILNPFKKLLLESQLTNEKSIKENPFHLLEDFGNINSKITKPLESPLCESPIDSDDTLVQNTPVLDLKSVGSHVMTALSSMRSSKLQLDSSDYNSSPLVSKKRLREINSISSNVTTPSPTSQRKKDSINNENNTPISKRNDNNLITPGSSKLLRAVESERVGSMGLRTDDLDWIDKLSCVPRSRERRISIMDNKQQQIPKQSLSENNKNRLKRNNTILLNTIPLEWTLKNSITLLSALPFDFLINSNPCDGVSGFIELGLNKSSNYKPTSNSIYQYLQSWIFPAGDRPPSSISLCTKILSKVTSQNDGSIIEKEVENLKSYEKMELEHLLGLERKWRESLDYLTFMLQENRIDYFYFLSHTFSVVFFSQTRAKNRYVASLSGASNGLRTELISNEVKFHLIPNISSSLTMQEHLDVNKLQSNKFNSTDCLQFYDDNVFKLLGYLRSWHERDVQLRANNSPRLICGSSFFNASLHRAEMSKLEKVRYDVVDPVSKLKLEYMHKLEIKGYLLPTSLNLFLNVVREKLINEPLEGKSGPRLLVYDKPKLEKQSNEQKDENKLEINNTNNNNNYNNSNNGNNGALLLTMSLDTMERTKYLLPFDELQYRNSKINGSRKGCISQIVCRHRMVQLK